MLKKTILITGANGEIGQSLIKSFYDNPNYKIIALDLSGNIYDLDVDYFLTGSITDKNNIVKNKLVTASICKIIVCVCLGNEVWAG